MPRLSKAEKERYHKEILEMEQAKIKPYLDRIAELEKENAELKEEVLEVRQQLNLTEKEWGKDLDKQIHYKTQFSKAKELLKRYLPYRQITDSKAYKDLAEEAEQFLSEVKK